MNTRNKKPYISRWIVVLTVLLLICISVALILQMRFYREESAFAQDSSMGILSTNTDGFSFGDNESLAAFAKDHNLSLREWPDSLIELLEKNPETTDFVLNYPLKKNLKPDIDLSEYINCDEVPLFLQWDDRWGYSEYAGEIMGLSGCGPACLSMVCMYIFNDALYSPRYIADFAQQNGYYVSGNGSTWTLISEGGTKLGLDVEEIPLDENIIIENLEAGNPIICVMGPGDFTSTGHFIVMTDYVDGKIKINDPNSPIRSGMLWEYAAIKDQFRNLWVCS